MADGTNWQLAAQSLAGAPAQPSAPPAAPPVQPSAPPARRPGVLSDILHAVASVLGGPSTTQAVDPQTGAPTTVPLSRSQRIANTAGIVMRGAAAGAAQSGPAAMGKAALAGVEGQQNFQQQQNTQLNEQARLKQSALEQQATRALQAQQIAESSWRMAREQTEIDMHTADTINGLRSQVALDPNSKDWGEYKSFQDFVDTHSELSKAGVNLAQLQAQGRLTAVPVTQNGKITGVEVFELAPDFLKSKNSEPVTIKAPNGLDAKGNVTYAEHTIQPNSVSNGDILNYQTAQSQDLMKGAEASVRAKQELAETSKAQAETVHTNAETNLVNSQAKALISSQQADPFDYVSPLPTKEALKRQDAFQKDTINKVMDTEKAYTMANQAYSEYKAAGGNLPTGAQSMLLLSQHLGTTFGNVKGARVTKDMIAEHLGARGITDSAVVAVNRLINGDQLSSAQWDAFVGLIGQSRNATWENAISSAKNQQIPITFLPRGTGQAKADPNTIKLYLDAADGDQSKAITALQKQGWQ